VSRRNTLEAKRARRARKLLRTPLPAVYDVVNWLRLQKNISHVTARAVINYGAVKTRGGNTIRDPYINPNLIGELVIRPPKNDE